MAYMVRLEKEGAELVVGEGDDKIVYHNGDEFEIPRGWRYNAQLSAFLKKPTFSYDVPRRTRDQSTGRWVTVKDTKDVSLPVIVVEDAPEEVEEA